MGRMALWSKGPFTLYKRSLEVEGKVTASISQIASAAKDILAFRDSGAWAIGDLAVYAEDIGKDNAIDDVSEAIVKDRHWVRKCYYVSKAIAKDERTFELWWTFYYAVYTFPSDVRNRLLKLAEDNAWTLDEFKAHLRSLRHAVRNELQKFPVGQYGLIYADPPWKYDNAGENGGGFNGAAVNHYPPMELDEIKGLADPDGRSVIDLAGKHCILYLWATAPFLEDALSVAASWGFEYKTCMIWEKDLQGTGFWSRIRHEILLICTKGEPVPPAEDKRPDSIIMAPRTDHSAKPPVVYDMLEELFPSLPKIELFAVEKRDGWDLWGNKGPIVEVAPDALPEVDPDTGDVEDAGAEQVTRDAKKGKKRKTEPKARVSDATPAKKSAPKPRLVKSAKKKTNGAAATVN